MGAGSGLDADTVDGMQASELLSWGNITGKPGSFNPAAHNHDDRYYTESESDARFANLSSYNSHTSDTNIHKSWGLFGTNGGQDFLGRGKRVIVAREEELILNYSGDFPKTIIQSNLEVDGNIYENGTLLSSKYLGAGAKAVDSNLLDGINSSQFLRSDTSDTLSGSLTVTGEINTRLIGSRGTELIIGAGEMANTMNGSANGENLWLGGEGGVMAVSSPDNLASGWTGAHKATLIDTSGNSQFPGTINASGGFQWTLIN
jgi:hypothetical protein